MAIGIPTPYGGLNMRSRLEATWAAFFDALGWKYDFEPFDLEGYIPDFIILGEKPIIVDVKPAVTAEELEARALSTQVRTAKLSAPINYDWLFVGGAGPMRYDDMSTTSYWSGGCVTLGPMIDQDWQPDTPPTKQNLGWSVLNHCRNCGQWGVIHDWMSFAGRPCGCHDGDHYLFTPSYDACGAQDAWRAARNAVQWKPNG